MSEVLKSAAFHEAGHVVMAYFTGYSCDEMMIEKNGNGMTKMNYGEDHLLITALLNPYSFPPFLKSLPEEQLINVPVIAKRTCSILISGSLSESIFKTKSKNNGQLQVDLTGPDLTKAEQIASIAEFDLDQEMQQLYHVLSANESWTAIKRIAHSVINNSSNELSRIEIEETLNQCGYINYINSI